MSEVVIENGDRTGLDVPRGAGARDGAPRSSIERAGLGAEVRERTDDRLAATATGRLLTGLFGDLRIGIEHELDEVATIEVGAASDSVLSARVVELEIERNAGLLEEPAHERVIGLFVLDAVLEDGKPLGVTLLEVAQENLTPLLHLPVFEQAKHDFGNRLVLEDARASPKGEAPQLGNDRERVHAGGAGAALVLALV